MVWVLVWRGVAWRGVAWYLTEIDSVKEGHSEWMGAHNRKEIQACTQLTRRVTWGGGAWENLCANPGLTFRFQRDS